MTLKAGCTYRVKSDNRPFQKGEKVRFIKVTQKTYDKGDSSEIYQFYSERLKTHVEMEHFGDSRSTRMTDIFEEIQSGKKK